VKQENRENKRKNFLLYLITTIIIVYIAVPTYGIIRDLGSGEAVFILNSPIRDVNMARPELGFFDRIHDFLFPPQEVPVPILQRIDLKGRVVYTDRTPYINGIVELKSEPRYTRTDAGGYFFFIDVEAGAHTVSVLDEAGNVLARCHIEIERTIQVKDAELVRLPDGTLVFQVAVDIRVLEITLFLKKGPDGGITGIDRVELGITPDREAESIPQEEPEVPLVEPPVEPVEPAEPPEESNKPHKPKPTPSGFDVFDSATTARYGRESAVSVNIFGTGKRIAPGMKGSYQFTVDNRGNDSPSLYDVTFTPIDTLPAPNKIPMRYRLKADGVYVAGDNNTWCTPAQLYQDTILAGKSHVKYTLEWYWPEGARDNDYAAFGGNPNYSYSLTIKVTAQIQ